MFYPRLKFFFIFVIALGLALTVGSPAASSQTYSTTTFQVTTTALYTYPVSTQYASTTQTTYLAGPNQNLIIQGYTATSCGYHQFEFNATAGQTFLISWTVTTPTPESVDFYVITPSESKEFSFSCFGGFEPESLYSNSGRTGLVNWIAPSTGGYLVFLLNPNPDAVPVSFSLQTQTTYSIAHTMSETVTSTSIVPMSQTVTASLPYTLSTSVFSVPETVMVPVGVGILIALVAVGSTWRRSRRVEPARGQLSHKPEKPPIQQGLQELSVCPNCQFENSEGSIFCRRCGYKFGGGGNVDVEAFEARSVPGKPSGLSMKGCPRCGNLNPRDNAFCGRCGWAYDDTRVYK